MARMKMRWRVLPEGSDKRASGADPVSSRAALAEISSGPEILAREARAGHLLRRAYHAAREQSSLLLRDLDITPRQSAALQAIAANDSLSQAEIGLAIGMEPANVHGLLSRLRNKQLIQIARDPADARRMRVSLTAAGQALEDRLVAVAWQAEEQTLERLSRPEQIELVRLLRKLLGA